MFRPPPISLHNLWPPINTYLVNFGLYKIPEIPTHDLHCVNNVTFNYKYDLVVTKLFIVEKDFRKTTKI
jgi:hypothetical protein